MREHSPTIQPTLPSIQWSCIRYRNYYWIITIRNAPAGVRAALIGRAWRIARMGKLALNKAENKRNNRLWFSGAASAKSSDPADEFDCRGSYSAARPLFRAARFFHSPCPGRSFQRRLPNSAIVKQSYKPLVDSRLWLDLTKFAAASDSTRPAQSHPSRNQPTFVEQQESVGRRARSAKTKLL